MKRIILLICLCIFAVGSGSVYAQKTREDWRKISFATTFGTGFSMNKPASTPVLWQFVGYYNPTARWSVGVGTGLSFYEKMLVPLFGDVKYQIGRERMFTPYVEMAGGYSFAPSAKANGGVFLNPSVGVQYRINGRLKLRLAAGWEMQRLERLREQTDSYFHKEFAEKLNHSLISLRLGLVF